MMTGCGVHAGSAEMIFKRRSEMKFLCLSAAVAFIVLSFNSCFYECLGSPDQVLRGIVLLDKEGKDTLFYSTSSMYGQSRIDSLLGFVINNANGDTIEYSRCWEDWTDECDGAWMTDYYLRQDTDVADIRIVFTLRDSIVADTSLTIPIVKREVCGVDGVEGRKGSVSVVLKARTQFISNRKR